MDHGDHHAQPVGHRDALLLVQRGGHNNMAHAGAAVGTTTPSSRAAAKAGGQEESRLSSSNCGCGSGCVARLTSSWCESLPAKLAIHSDRDRFVCLLGQSHFHRSWRAPVPVQLSANTEVAGSCQAAKVTPPRSGLRVKLSRKFFLH